jgi:hypothetical protein
MGKNMNRSQIKFLLVFLVNVFWSHLICSEALAQVTSTPASISTQKTEGRQILVMLHLPAPHYRPDFAYSSNYLQDASRSARRKIAEKIAQEMQLKLVEDWPMPILNIDCFKMEIIGDYSVFEVIEKLNQDKRVVWAQSVSNFETKSGLNQTEPLTPVQPAQKFWSIQEVHRVTTGKQVLIAVVDSAVETQHTDLLGQVLFQENFVDGKQNVSELHGTNVAGVIAARSTFNGSASLRPRYTGQDNVQ